MNHNYDYINELKNCETEKSFKKIWNPDKFNWDSSWQLARSCSDYFHIWFNPDKYDWNHSDYLTQDCSDYFCFFLEEKPQ